MHSCNSHANKLLLLCFLGAGVSRNRAPIKSDFPQKKESSKVLRFFLGTDTFRCLLGHSAVRFFKYEWDFPESNSVGKCNASTQTKEERRRQQKKESSSSSDAFHISLLRPLSLSSSAAKCISALVPMNRSYLRKNAALATRTCYLTSLHRFALGN